MSAAVALASRPAAAEPPLETTTVRISELPAACLAPQVVAEELLRADGFTDVQSVKFLGAGKSPPVDFWVNDAPNHVMDAEGGRGVALAGFHSGCYQLFATNQVRSIRDLKGKTVAVPGLLRGRRVFLAAMAASVGLDPDKDITWVILPDKEAIRLFAEGKIDAILGWPPEPEELRAKKVGHLLVDTLTDRPWAQYFCCMLIATREFARTCPVATKRVLRAVLKAADICAQEPERAAHRVMARGFAEQYDSALKLIKELGYRQWRQYDPEETIRFYALRLREANLIKSSPQKIIAQGTDWRFLKELKKELKA